MLIEVAKLDWSELVSEISPSHGSIFALLRHMLVVETYYLLLVQERADEFKNVEYDNLEDLINNWHDLSKKWIHYLSTLDASKLTEEIPLYMGKGQVILPRYQLLIQGFTHSIHHRGELSIILSGLDYPLPTMDSLLYFIKESGQEWPPE